MTLAIPIHHLSATVGRCREASRVWQGDCVCSVVLIIRHGTARLKDDGAPPFFSAIERRLHTMDGIAAPKKIVPPIAAGAVASRSLTRAAPRRAAASPFHSSGGDDGALRPHSGTQGRTGSELQCEGNPADQARTRNRVGGNDPHHRGVRCGNGGALRSSARCGSGAQQATPPHLSGRLIAAPQCRSGVLCWGVLGRSTGRGLEGQGIAAGERGTSQDKRRVGHRRFCGCERRICLSDGGGARRTSSLSTGNAIPWSRTPSTMVLP